jgi:hypothetical protein
LGFVESAFDGCGERCGPILGVGRRVAADQFLGHAGVLDVVQVSDFTAEIDRDSVATDVEVLVLQGLVDATYELEELI